MAFADLTFTQGVWKGGFYPFSFTAGGTILPGMIVAISGTTVVPAGTDEQGIGVAITKASAGQDVAVVTHAALVEVGAASAISAGALVVPATVSNEKGWAKALGTETTVPVGIAIESIASGSIGTILLFR